MRVKIQFLKERFAYFNGLCFEGKLPDIKLRLSSSLRTLGALRYKKSIFGQVKREDIVLSISNRLDLDQQVIEDTIIHEMIHLYILWSHIKDTSAHGVQFRRIMNHINLKHGRSITISHRGNAEEKNTDRIHKLRIVIISHLDSGGVGVTVCSPRYTLAIHSVFMKWRMVRNLEIISTYDPVFAHYPSSRTPKIYHIERAVLERILADAVMLEINNGKLRPKLK